MNGQIMYVCRQQWIELEDVLWLARQESITLPLAIPSTTETRLFTTHP